MSSVGWPSPSPPSVVPGPRPGADVIRREHHLDADPYQRHGNERLPAEPHDLVIAVARESGPQPQKYEEKEEDLQSEPEKARLAEDRGADARPSLPGREPSAEEEHRRQRRDQDHVGVLGEEEERECDPRVLDVEARDDLRLALGHVERRAVGLRDTGDEVDDEERKQPEPVPGEEP